METFDKGKLSERLAEFEPWKRLAFMALTSERMLPNFQRFSVETKFGNASVLREALDAVWRHIEPGNIEKRSLDELKVACERQAPDTEQFSSIYTSAALDAANAVAALLDALRDPTADIAVEVAELARDTVDMFIQQIASLDPSAGDLERKILLHPLMQRELLSQRADVEKLERLSDKDRSSLRSLRQTSGSLEIENEPNHE